MCIVVRHVKATGTRTEESIFSHYELFEFAIDKSCVEKEGKKEQYERYKVVEALLQATMDIKSIVETKFKEAIKPIYEPLNPDDKEEQNKPVLLRISQPFIVWYALASYDEFKYTKINIYYDAQGVERDVDESMQSIQNIPVERRLEPIFNEVRDEVKKIVEEELKKVYQNIKSLVIKDEINELTIMVQEMRKAYKETLKIVQEKNRQLEEQIERMQKDMANEIKRQVEEQVKEQIEKYKKEQEKKIVNKIVNAIDEKVNTLKSLASKLDMKLSFIKEKTKEKVKKIFKRDNDRNNDKNNERNNDKNNDRNNDRGLEL